MNVINIINFTSPEISGLVSVIAWLIQISGSIALGIVLFTLALKLITLPFDYFSRASMRKNNIKMEQMRPELEKLQEQCKDNKELYSQKMMALYKKNGYSMWGSCLPTILTLVIFIVAINAFTSYSQYQNQKYFYDMSCSYNRVVYEGIEADGEYILHDEETGVITLKEQKLVDKLSGEESLSFQPENEEHQIIIEKNGEYLYVYTNPGYVKVYFEMNATENGYIYNYELIEGKISEYSGKSELSIVNEYNNYLMLVTDGENPTVLFSDSDMTEKDFITDIRQQKSAQTFREENEPFLWIKNIWATDSPLKHPITSKWVSDSETGCISGEAGFKETHKYEGNDIGQDGYDQLIMKLESEQTDANGYFILIALTAISSFVTQWVTKKTQKAQMELQTVDGQGAQTQKMMMWMMPIMMAMFAFMYTAAFSIYIIMSSAISLGMTFLINYIVDKKMAKEEKKASKDGGEKIRGRVYQPKKQEETAKKEEPKKSVKDDKFAHESGGDFLTGPKKNKK